MEAFFAAPRHKFTVDEVLAMVRQGIIDEDDRVELIEGDLVEMSPQRAPHASSTSRLDRHLQRRR